MINNTEVLVTNLFPNLVATKNLNLSNFKVKGKNFKKTFESNIKTTLNKKLQNETKKETHVIRHFFAMVLFSDIWSSAGTNSP